VPGESAETFIGIGGLGVGAVLLFGAVKNVSVFGPNGLITSVVKSGKFPDLATVPPMFPSLDAKANVLPVAQMAIVDEGIAAIASKNPALAAKLTSAFLLWDPAKNPTGTSTINSLLAQATADGYSSQVSTIRAGMAAAATSAATPSANPSTPSTPSTSNPVISV
jgi:hypothetical protein